MTLQDLVDRVCLCGVKTVADYPNDQHLAEIVHATVQCLGLYVAPNGQIVRQETAASNTIEWQPPGGLKRPRKSYRYGKARR